MNSIDYNVFDSWDPQIWWGLKNEAKLSCQETNKLHSGRENTRLLKGGGGKRGESLSVMDACDEAFPCLYLTPPVPGQGIRRGHSLVFGEGLLGVCKLCGEQPQYRKETCWIRATQAERTVTPDLHTPRRHSWGSILRDLWPLTGWPMKQPLGGFQCEAKCGGGLGMGWWVLHFLLTALSNWEGVLTASFTTSTMSHYSHCYSTWYPSSILVIYTKTSTFQWVRFYSRSNSYPLPSRGPSSAAKLAH